MISVAAGWLLVNFLNWGSPGIFNTQQPLGFTQNGEKNKQGKKTHLVSDRNVLLMSERSEGNTARLVQTDRKAKEMYLTTLYNHGEQKSI